MGFFGSRSGQKKIGHADDLYYLREIHPRAFRFLEEHGRDYRPKIWKKAPTVEPEKGGCFRNACLLMMVAERHNERRPAHARPIAYVEGVALGLCAAMLHAWNARGVTHNKAIDWTLYAVSPWNRYFGIPLSPGEHRDAMLRVDPSGIRFGSILHRENFVRVEPCLREVCAARQ